MAKTTSYPRVSMTDVISDHFRCPEQFLKIGLAGELSGSAGYFRFGPNITCYGRCVRNGLSPDPNCALPDATADLRWEGDRILLPFDLSEVVSNFRMERYCVPATNGKGLPGRGRVVKNMYYLLRPLLGISIRKYLQRAKLRNWNRISFPHWPVDFTVENLLEHVLTSLLQESGISEIPFIWFWPDGALSSAVVTHDVEGPSGLKFCEQLMSIDESFGVRSAFQVVPEKRYAHDPEILARFWQRGFEVNVHDLNHDGALFGKKDEFIRRAKLINEYAKKFGTRGFRAGAMYRRQDWYDAFDLSYDMSVPNVAHLEPQRGGCCTAMPYFIGNILELPLTTTQDYSLFYIIGDYSIDLWKQQIDIIRERHGLISFIVHPDYIIEERAQRVYRDLLAHLSAIRQSARLWMALPGEVDLWWRSRSAMKLIPSGSSWKIEGPQSERARLAFATLRNGRLAYRLQ